jgi:hypothetical protein
MPPSLTPSPERALPSRSPAGHVVDGLSLVGRIATLPSGESGTILQQLADGQVVVSLLPDSRLTCLPLVGLILHAQSEPADTTPLLNIHQAAELLSISTRTLRRRLERAPPDLEGAPIDLSAGRRRQLRWARQDVLRWARAYERWRRAPKARPARRTRVTPRPAPARGRSLYAQAFPDGT